MNRDLTIAAILAALCALPAATAHHAGPDVTVTADPNGVGCQTQRYDVEDLLGPAFNTRTDVWFEDCAASASYQGLGVVARCAAFSTRSLVWYNGPDVTIGSDCDLTVEI